MYLEKKDIDKNVDLNNCVFALGMETEKGIITFENGVYYLSSEIAQNKILIYDDILLPVHSKDISLVVIPITFEQLKDLKKSYEKFEEKLPSEKHQ